MEKNKVITRTRLGTEEGSGGKIVEKSITVMELGTIKTGRERVIVSRPAASDFTVWLEGKRYESKMRMDEKEKKLLVDLDSPESKWKGRTSFTFPNSRYFCFFSQIPDCLNLNLLLKKAQTLRNKPLPFIVVWDNYPYIQDQFTGVGLSPFSKAFLKFEGSEKKVLKYVVEIEGQTVVYHFSSSFDLMRILWIAQGLSILPLGEEQNAADE